MHVAICDDNVADRKHLERLLSREADKKAGTSDNIFVNLLFILQITYNE